MKTGTRSGGNVTITAGYVGCHQRQTRWFWEMVGDVDDRRRGDTIEEVGIGLT